MTTQTAQTAGCPVSASEERLCDAIAYALYTGLGERVPVRDQVLAGLSPAEREELDAALARHRDRVAAREVTAHMHTYDETGEHVACPAPDAPDCFWNEVGVWSPDSGRYV